MSADTNSGALVIVRVTHVDADWLLEHARKQQRRAVSGGGSWQLWTRIIAALEDGNTPRDRPGLPAIVCPWCSGATAAGGAR